MPRGHTTKQTLTPYRRKLLLLAARPGGVTRRELTNPERKHLNDMTLFGWATLEGIGGDGKYEVTDAGRVKLAEP